MKKLKLVDFKEINCTHEIYNHYGGNAPFESTSYDTSTSFDTSDIYDTSTSYDNSDGADDSDNHDSSTALD